MSKIVQNCPMYNTVLEYIGSGVDGVSSGVEGVVGIRREVGIDKFSWDYDMRFSMR